MKVLMTGSTGFLGSRLTTALVNEGYEVIILKRSFSNTWRISDVLSKVKVYNIDQSPLEQPFIECGPIEVIIHTATMYDRNGENASQLQQSNVAFPLRLLETAIAFQTRLFINTDSFINKNNLGYKHLASYALSKKQFLEWGRELSSAEKIHFMNIRLEHIYGSFDSESKFNSYIFKSCLSNVPELHLSPGNQKRDFIHINDIISAYSLLLKVKTEDVPFFKEYELGTGEAVTIRDFVELIHRMCNSRTNLKFGAFPHRENEIMESKANTEELRRLGWHRTIDLKKGIEMILQEEGKFHEP